jgi:hypothetical protein
MRSLPAPQENAHQHFDRFASNRLDDTHDTSRRHMDGSTKNPMVAEYRRLGWPVHARGTTIFLTPGTLNLLTGHDIG